MINDLIAISKDQADQLKVATARARCRSHLDMNLAHDNEQVTLIK
jgi:hypothetical protein